MLDGFEATPGYPPYNIERTGETAYRISVAVAGFSESELSIEAKENTLTIKGEKQAKDERTSGQVLHQGIAARAFERVFQLADYVQVKGASLENGLLHVDLVREDPRGQEAAPDPDRQWPREAPAQGGRVPSRLSTRLDRFDLEDRLYKQASAPVFRALSFCARHLLCLFASLSCAPLALGTNQ